MLTWLGYARGHKRASTHMVRKKGGSGTLYPYLRANNANMFRNRRANKVNATSRANKANVSRQPHGAAMHYIEIDGHRRTAADWIDQGLVYAEPAQSPAEEALAVALLAELFDQCQGRGLVHAGGGSSDTGKQTIVVAGSLDLVALALARSALAAIARRETA